MWHEFRKSLIVTITNCNNYGAYVLISLLPNSGMFWRLTYDGDTHTIMA